MTPLNPSLRLTRLIVSKSGKSAYDETFHSGVNIIRGANSSGKSSIADFIHFVLGGDVVKWKQVAKSCDYVVAGLQVSGKDIAVRRKVTEARNQPMDIFWGDVSDALESAIDGWETYSFRRSENKDSFSQALFRAIGLPELRSDTDSNITMHQLLRLMFVDQLTPPDALMSEESFDSPFIRQTVGDYLLGVFDDALYRDQMLLKQLEKSSGDLKTRISTLVEAFSDLEQESDIVVLEASINEKQGQLDRIAVAIKEASLTVVEEDASPDDSADLQQNYNLLRTQRAKLNESIVTLSVEIEDSEKFIDELLRRSLAVEESLQMRNALGSIEVQVCPNCLQNLTRKHSPTDCRLCGQPWPKDLADGQRLRMQQELALQIRESTKLLEDKRQRLAELKKEIPSLRSEIKIAYARFSDSLSKTKTNRDSMLDQLFEKRGSLENDLTYLLRFQKSAATFAQLKDASTKQAAEIRELQMSIEKQKRELGSRVASGFQAISKVAVEFLRSDIPSEELFETADDVTVDFSKNTFSVDGLNQFSASSMTLLKNSVHFAFLFASLELEFFRYPRLIICDNIEDKGMVPERSQNFQKLVVERSSAAEFEHQIIFTTSMIDPSLDDTELCVGAKYDHAHKSLKI
jgi:hypothetical protein